MPPPKTLVFAALSMILTGVHPAPAQTQVALLAVQSGNGQVACQCSTGTLGQLQPIAVKATDANGNPVSGATVTWTVTSGPMTLGSANTTTVTTITGADGVSATSISTYFTNNSATSLTPDLVATVQATCNNHAVTFTETQSLIVATGTSEVVASPPTFNGGTLSQTTFSANAGTTLSTPILVQLGGANGANVGANVAVRILNAQASPSLTCANIGGYADPGSVLTNAQGLATCYPVFNGSGTGTFYVTVGGVPAGNVASALYLQEFGPYTFTAIPGAPAAIQIVSGNDQIGSSGQPLNPLVAKVLDANGNAVQNQTVVWSIGPAGAATLTNVQTVTDNNGEVSASPALNGAAASAALITVALQANANISAAFQVTLVGVLTSLSKIGGDSQTAQSGTNFAQPLVLQLNAAGGPLKSYPLQFVTNGPVSLPGGNTVSTDANGQVSVTVKAGATTGPAAVTAIAGLLSQTFTLTVASTSVSAAPTGVSKVAGDAQTAIIDTSFAAPLVVQVASAAGPVAGALVSFAVTGPASISSTAATTASNGQAQITVQAGSSAGAATVTASIAGFSATFNLTVLPPGPAVTASSFLNAASRQVGSISPCSLAIISAPGLTPDGVSDYSLPPKIGRLPLSVHNLSVVFNNVQAPISDVSMGSVNPEITVQVPCEVTPGNSVPVTVNVGAGSATVNVAVQTVSPGIFETVMSDGVKRAVVVRDDGSFVDIGGAIQNPARRGENVRIYATGLGATFPAVGTDSIQNPNADLVGRDTVVAGTVQVGLSGTGGLQVVSARQAPDTIGIYEIQFLLPSNATTGNSVTISLGITPLGGGSSGAPVYAVNSTIPIQ